MIEGYGTFSTDHVWLGIDPGVTTGIAILDDNGELVGTTQLHAETVGEDLDELIRKIHRADRTIAVVREKIARVGSGALAQTLDQVLRDIHEVVIEVYDLPTHEVTPGEWKPSRVAKQLRPELDKKLSAHEKDAACMAAYIRAKGTRPNANAQSHKHGGRPRLEDTPKRVAQRIRDEKRREKRRADRANG
jgi:hypothetical protein